MKYDGLIVGLGNPGPQYLRTRHNFGFMLADCLLAHWSKLSGVTCVQLKTLFQTDLWSVSTDYGAQNWLLAKPQTFMNLSGHSVRSISSRHGLSTPQILIMHDELDLPLGTVRFKFSGGLAGHNGLKSIAGCLGTRDFARLRLGIGRPLSPESVTDYVLRGFFPEEQSRVRDILQVATSAVLDFCSNGLDAAMERLHAQGAMF